MVNIITKNLVIRKFTIDDVPAYFENNNEEQIKNYMPHHSHDNIENAREEITNFLSGYEKLNLPCHFAITKDGVLIGHIGIGKSGINDEMDEICEIDCAISKNYRRHGYSIEASKAFIPWCKSAFGLEKIYATSNKENLSSNKSLLSIGFALTEIKANDKSINVYVC
jgi:RimJ/RimL family protein N-acetyltransferase